MRRTSSRDPNDAARGVRRPRPRISAGRADLPSSMERGPAPEVGPPAAAPTVSVTMTVRNGLPHVTEAVASVLGQDFADLELVVVDDGSADGTLEALRRVDDPRLRVLARPPNGRVAALNTAVGVGRVPRRPPGRGSGRRPGAEPRGEPGRRPPPPPLRRRDPVGLPGPQPDGAQRRDVPCERAARWAATIRRTSGAARTPTCCCASPPATACATSTPR